MQNNNKLFRFVIITLLLIIGLSLFYNFYALFFPIETTLESDTAEHLHAAYLLSIGQRPYIDFIQNHPMLFHHFLNWIEKSFNIGTSRQLAAVGRVTIFAHFIICIAVFCLWTSEMLRNRSRGIMWVVMLIAAWSMLDIYNPEFHWMWDLRPDFICYGQTLLGLYLIYRWLKRPSNSNVSSILLFAVLGGCLIGFGNAVIPKGIPFIAAFAMTLVVFGLSADRDILVSWLNRFRVKGLIIIGMATVLSFIAGMVLDCYLSNVSPQKWFTAVFLLNSKKHIIFSNADGSSISQVLNIFAFPMPLTIVLMTWIVWELAIFGKKGILQKGQASIWLFSIFTILVNIILPAYSNGVTWSYYFIPSVFSAAAICLLLILRLREFFMNHSFLFSYSIANGAAILVAGFIAFQILNSPFQFFTHFTARKAAAREVAETSPSDFINDVVLPKDFTYLGYPDRMPIKSRNWGYYFMLAHSTNFWNDCHALGLGPDPKEIWRKEFSGRPPDAITLTRPGELSWFVLVVGKCQGINISWLQDEIRERYVLMIRPGASMYVLADIVPQLESQGWRVMPE